MKPKKGIFHIPPFFFFRTVRFCPKNSRPNLY